jgi:hypothetical protein
MAQNLFFPSEKKIKKLPRRAKISGFTELTRRITIGARFIFSFSDSSPAALGAAITSALRTSRKRTLRLFCPLYYYTRARFLFG